MRAPTKGLERRIEQCWPKARDIIRPEQGRVEACQGAVASAIRSLAATAPWPNPKTIADQMKAIERELAKISESLASDQRRLRVKVESLADVFGGRNAPPPGAELAARRLRRTTTEARPRMMAVILAADLMDNFADPTAENLPGATVKSPHAKLAVLLYEAATGAELPILGLKHQVKEYFKEMVAHSRDQVTNRARRRRSRRRDQRVIYPP